MLRFQRGDVGAFSELGRRHQLALFNFVLRHVHSAPIAEQILQDVLLYVVHHSAEFKQDTRFSTWLYGIAHNACLEQPMLGSGAAADDAPSDEPETRELIARTVEQLPEEQREVFLLRELANIPFHEIAVITGAPEPQVKSRMRHALERLHQALDAPHEPAPTIG